MRRTITNILSEAKGKLNGYTALLDYRYANLCVEADGKALLSVSVSVDDAEQPLEDVAIIGNSRKDQFAIYPKNQFDLPYIIKGVMTAHPEYKLDIKDWDDYPEEVREEGEEYHYLLFTMPEVNKSRRDALLDGVNVLHEQWDTTCKEVKGESAARLASVMVGQDKDAIDKVKGQLDEMYDMYHSMGEKYTEDKKNEIEEGYQRYLKEQADQQLSAQAQNSNAGSSMKMGVADDDNDY